MCSHIKPTPRTTISVCLLPALRRLAQLHLRAFVSRSTDLLHVSFGRPLLLFPAGVQRMATLGMDVGGILLTCPIHLDFFSLPLTRWAASQFALGAPVGYFVWWPKELQNSSYLRDLFWNSSSMWHIPLVTFHLFINNR